MADKKQINPSEENALPENTGEDLSIDEIKIDNKALDELNQTIGVESQSKPNTQSNSKENNLEGINDISSYIQQKKEQEGKMMKKPTLVTSIDGTDLKKLKNIYAVVPNKKGEHKLVYMRDEAPSGLLPDEKGRVKGTTYEKRGRKVYEVHADFMVHPTLRGRNGEFLGVRIIDQPEDLSDQITALQEGVGKGINFLDPLVVNPPKDKPSDEKKKDKIESTDEKKSESTKEDIDEEKAEKTLNEKVADKLIKEPLEAPSKEELVEQGLAKEDTKEKDPTEDEIAEFEIEEESEEEAKESVDKPVEDAEEEAEEEKIDEEKTNEQESNEESSEQPEESIDNDKDENKENKIDDDTPTDDTPTEEQTKGENNDLGLDLESIIIEEPSIEESIQSPMPVEKPSGKVDEPILEKSVIDEPTLDETVTNETFEELSIKDSISKKEPVEEPVIPIGEELLIKEPIIKEPIIEESIAEQKVTNESEAEPIEESIEQSIPKEALAEEEIITQPPVLDIDQLGFEENNLQDEQAVEHETVEDHGTESKQLEKNQSDIHNHSNDSKHSYNAFDKKTIKEFIKKMPLGLIIRIIGATFLVLLLIVILRIAFAGSSSNDQPRQDQQQEQVEDDNLNEIDSDQGDQEDVDEQLVDDNTNPQPTENTNPQQGDGQIFTLNELKSKLEAQQSESSRLLNRAKLLGNNEAIKFSIAAMLKASHTLEKIQKNQSITAGEVQRDAETIDLYIKQADNLVN